MLKQDMIQKLNIHMNLEFYSANIYLQMSAWSKKNIFEGSAKFFRKHAQEEMTHMMKLFDYLGNTSMPVISAIKAPNAEFNSLCDLVEQAYAHEKYITSSINTLINNSMVIKDYATFNFLQWYVTEQQEEEGLFKNMIDLLLLFGNTSEGLFLLDKKFSTL